MATLQERVQSYVGPISDSAGLAEWLSSGAARVIELMKDDKLMTYATTLSVPNGGADITGSRFVYARRNGYQARAIAAGHETEVQDPNSLYAARFDDPIFIIRDAKVYIYPIGGTAQAFVVKNPSPAVSDTVIDHFPSEHLDAVILYAAIQALNHRVSDALLGFDAEPTLPVSQDLSALFTQLNTYLNTDQDLELARGVVEQINTYITKLSTESRSEVERFTADVTGLINEVQGHQLLQRKLEDEYNRCLMLYFGRTQQPGAPQ